MLDPGTLQNIHIPRPMMPLYPKYPSEAALMENLQTMMLFLCGVPDFVSTKQYRESRRFVDPDRSVGLYFAILPDIV